MRETEGVYDINLQNRRAWNISKVRLRTTIKGVEYGGYNQIELRTQYKIKHSFHSIYTNWYSRRTTDLLLVYVYH